MFKTPLEFGIILNFISFQNNFCNFKTKLFSNPNISLIIMSSISVFLVDTERLYETCEAIDKSKELKNFYKFSKKKNRPIDECFFDVYQVYCKGDLNG